MSKTSDIQPKIFLIGILPPSRCSSAAHTVSLANSLAASDVTVVISNQAPPYREEASAPFKVVRERDISTDTNKYKDHLRLFVLGNNHESLFALGLYQLHGGKIIAGGHTLSGLQHTFYRNRGNGHKTIGWPHNYADALEAMLDDEGTIVANALIQHRRESSALLEEIIVGVSDAAYEDKDFVLADDLLEVINLQERDARGQTRQNAPEPDTLTLLYTGDTETSELIAGFSEMTAALPASFEAHKTSGDEVLLADKVAEAEIVLIADTTSTPPPLFWLAVAAGKAIITCGQRWLGSLTHQTSLNVPRSNAVHALTAALGALVTNHDLRRWYAQQTAAFNALQPSPIDATKFIAMLGQQKPMQLQKTKAQDEPQHTGVADANSQRNTLSGEHKRPIALIGAVPPEQIVARHFPQVDYATSPRFATPQLIDALVEKDEPNKANKIALYGYESPIISTGPETDGMSWQSVQNGLCTVTEAISFGCEIDGAVSANHILLGEEKNGYEIQLNFRGIDNPKTMTHHSEKLGFLWEFNPVQHTVTGRLITGIPGKYRCNLRDNFCAVIQQGAETHFISSTDNHADLAADALGIIRFTISLHDPESQQQLIGENFTKTLAGMHLNLGWLAHG
jgi:hypothetical protein